VDKLILAMGIDHSIHRSLIYETSEYGGCGVRHLSTEVMGIKLKTVISHLHAETELRTSLKININYIQLLSCIGTPIFQSQEDISYIPMSWLLNVQQFLIEINTDLEISNKWLPKPQRQNNQFLKIAFQTMKATRSELIVLNNLEIYSRVILFSDICFTTGKGNQPIFLEYHHPTLAHH
jgi:hypothetical protein